MGDCQLKPLLNADVAVRLRESLGLEPVAGDASGSGTPPVWRFGTWDDYDSSGRWELFMLDGVLWMARRDSFLGLYVRGMLPTEHNLSQAAKMIPGVLIERLAVV
jgi:hypothetical protein